MTFDLTRYRKKRDYSIIEIANEAKDVLPDPYDGQIIDLVEDCTGYVLSEREKRLAIVAYETDAETAQSCIWAT
jgi:hypothetical protein